ncbi:hypothetical protein RCH07_002873 [Arthrobacter sp. CG_A4]|nr:hypothetical protein [Arthrobacter sp. CG_A4]
MTRDDAVFDLGGAFGNIDHRVPETTGAFFGIPVLFAAGPSGAQGLFDLAFESAEGLNVEGLVDRFVAHAHLLVIGEFLDQQLRNLLRGPAGEELSFHVVVQFSGFCQLTVLGPCPDCGGGPVSTVGQVAEHGVAVAFDLPADGAHGSAQCPADRLH